jgi:5-methylcytosine-specific restriction enzyme subunit McrC
MSDSTAKPDIPIQNLYYLLCYAWDQLNQGSFVDVGSTGATELVDLFAIVLVKGIEHLSRRGMERGYEAREEELRSLRGRINLLFTERRLLRYHGRAACSFDDLTTNTLPNQIIRSTLKSLVEEESLDPKNRISVLRVHRDLKGIDEIRVDSTSFRKVQLGRNTSFYRFLLNVCELIHHSRFAEQGGERYRFRDFIRDEKKMALVFQNFLFNFFKMHRPDFKVFRENIHLEVKR